MPRQVVLKDLSEPEIETPVVIFHRAHNLVRNLVFSGS